MYVMGIVAFIHWLISFVYAYSSCYHYQLLATDYVYIASNDKSFEKLTNNCWPHWNILAAMISSVVGLALNQILKFFSSSDLGMPWIFAIGQTRDCPAFLSGSALIRKYHIKMTFGQLPLRWTGVFWSIGPTFEQIFLINLDF